MEQDPLALTHLEALAERTEERAAHVRQLAAQARKEARQAAEEADPEVERVHLVEADAHDRSARAIEKTAALYRSRIGYLRHRDP